MVIRYMGLQIFFSCGDVKCRMFVIVLRQTFSKILHFYHYYIFLDFNKYTLMENTLLSLSN